MYLGAVTTCAKNFGRGRYRGLALAVPIAAYGLSGMWQSQLASRVLYERMPDGRRGDVDVFRFFVFLALLLFVVGLVGAFTLKIVNEEDLIDEAVEELERSGLLDGSALFSPSRGGYGAIERQWADDEAGNASASAAAVAVDGTPAKDDDEDDDSSDGGDNARRRKQWVLNAETRRFLTDHTMWLFAVGFFLMIGPGEAFINNLGTVIKTLGPPSGLGGGAAAPETSAATQVSLVGITSTAVRLLTGSLTDLLAPSRRRATCRSPRRRRCCAGRCAGCPSRASPSSSSSGSCSRPASSCSRPAWCRGTPIASGWCRLWSAPATAPYSASRPSSSPSSGASRTSAPTGHRRHVPRLGATVWGLVYSAIYQAGVEKRSRLTSPPPPHDNLCYGTQCYTATFWAMSVSVWIACGLVLLAWKGKNGWVHRGIVI